MSSGNVPIAPVFTRARLTSLHSGALPPQLLLETLLSLHHVLFLVSVDYKSATLVKSLVRKSKFDPDMTIDDGPIRALSDNFEYIYWGPRLKILRDITTNPPLGNTQLILKGRAIGSYRDSKL